MNAAAEQLMSAQLSDTGDSVALADLAGARVQALPLSGPTHEDMFVDGARYLTTGRRDRQTYCASVANIGGDDSPVAVVILTPVERRPAASDSNVLALRPTRGPVSKGGERGIDPGSGLLDRSTISQMLEVEVSRSRRYANPLSVIVAQVDVRRRDNEPPDESPPESLGDAPNDPPDDPPDDPIVVLARIFQEQTRWADNIGRWDGATLFMLLPETNSEAVEALSLKLSQQVASVGKGVQVQFGAASWQRGDDSALLTRRAFEALER